ncbi:MAG: hypothetical protein KC964_21310, partial [Candidatus Omnitrophica bacterium]|nr:hypothetical protein [Candidatus Omnitrophota bacterium]
FAIELGGDITSTSYRYHLWFDTENGNADFQVNIILRQSSSGNEQILATSNFSVVPLEPTIEENSVTGINPNAVAGDLLILEVKRTSTGVQLGQLVYGDCANDGTSEPVGYSWIEFTGSLAK